MVAEYYRAFRLSDRPGAVPVTAAEWGRTADRRVSAAEGPGAQVLTVTQLGRTA